MTRFRRRKLYFLLILGIICVMVFFSNFKLYNNTHNNLVSNAEIDVENKVHILTITNIEITQPTPNDAWVVGQVYNINWNCDSHNVNYINIFLCRDTRYKSNVKNNVIASHLYTQKGENSYYWKVPNVQEGNKYRILIEDDAIKKQYYSDFFTIKAARIINVNTLFKNNYKVGDSVDIKWTTKGPIKNVDIHIYNQLGIPSTIVLNTTNDGEYVWKIPWWYIQGTYYIRINDSNENEIYGDGPLFTVQGSEYFIIFLIFMVIAIISFTFFIARRNKNRIRLKKIDKISRIEKSPSIILIKVNLGYHLKFSPDGHFLIGSRKKYFKIWDYNTNELVGSYKTRGIKFIVSPDNKQIVTNKGEVIELNSLQKKEILRLKGFSSISSMDFSPDGKNIITSSSKKKRLKIRDSRNGNIITSISTEFPVSHIAFSHDGKNLIGFYGTKAFIWEYSSELLIQSLELNMIPRAHTLSPDGNYLYVGRYLIKEWDLATGKLLYTYKGHSNTILSMVITPDNRYLISSSSDNTIKIWDILYKSLMTTLYDVENESIGYLALHPEGKDLISSSSSNQFIIWKYKDYIRSEIERKNAIKNKIINLGSQYRRMQLNEIAETCNEDDEICRNILNQLIDEKVISAKYIESDDSVLFSNLERTNIMRKAKDNSTSSNYIEENLESFLSLTRGFEFIGGQVRFKIGLKNQSPYTLTDFKISFEIPDALKWIVHEPGYQRSGDTILIPKIGAGEKKAVSLYLEPINCMVSSINALISFHDEKDQPQAFTMTPEIISISCPLFFTEEEANIARVKRLQKSLHHHDRKVFPIIDSEKTWGIYESILSELSKHDIKLISENFLKEEQFGELWYYGITKYKKNAIITNVIIDGKNRTLEINVYGDDEGQITSFLAEVGGSIRQELIHHGIIKPDDRFYDIRASILASVCPYCMSIIPKELVEKYRNNDPVICNVCNTPLN